ncbi:YhjD/YihY/BrkB family envelope integrity protein [Taylorella equigenitalis]|uniref:YhjD/YihY/BrkB family envelope integrity protein n=1 Tax=Taylorella equigenitalis TaxID=29575 RepID=UPI000AF26236|nr:YhjD/YihY/BrkB family envelope integrity protein [Taylorella equigenitalis]
MSFISFSLIYKIVPNRQVHWKDALIGGATAALLFEGLKLGFAYYISRFPSYTLIYGTFATIPLFLLWIYISWIIVLAGALLVSMLPQLRYGFDQTYNKIGADFIQAIRILRLLDQSRNENPPGKSTNTIVYDIHGEIAHTLMILDKLKTLGYIVNTEGKRSERWVLASDYDMDMSKLKDMFILSSSIDKITDKNMKTQMARLLLDENVTLGDLLSTNAKRISNTKFSRIDGTIQNN